MLVEWIGDLVQYLDVRGLTLVEATEPAERAWSEHVQTVASYTLYPQADSWYLGRTYRVSRECSCLTSAESGSTGTSAPRWPPSATTASC